MSDVKPIVDDIQAVERLPFFVPRPKPSAIPTPGIFDEPTICLVINAEWASHFWGVIDALDQPDTWIPDERTVEWARQQIREALASWKSENCMPVDPCCPETNDLLTEIKVLNQTIVNNTTTVIVQNDTQIIQNYFATYNQWAYNNHQVSVLNQMLYDGTPQSISPNLGTDWSADAATRDALCLACKRYLEQVLWNCATAAALGGLAAGVAAAFITTVAVGLAGPTLGASLAWGLPLAAGIIIGAAGIVATGILTNTQAQLEVLCCMFDTLKDQTITRASFMAIGEGCTLEDENAQLLMDLIHQAAQHEGEYLGFLRGVGESQGAGNEAECFCCADIADYEIVAVNNCVVTKIDDTHYRIEQTVSTEGASDPFCTEGRYLYTAEFKESLGRCVDVTGSSQAMSYWQQIDCAGNTFGNVGGGGGQAILFRWYLSPCPPDTTTLDTIITIACPP